MRPSSLLVLAGALVGAACGSVYLKAPGLGGTAAVGAQQTDVRTAAARARTTGTAEVRRTCRGSRPAGYIAIDYVASDSTVCPSAPTRRSNYGTALIMKYDGLAIGETLSVCADQPVPTNWIRITYDDDDPRCPNDSPPSEPRPTVMTIRRSR